MLATCSPYMYVSPLLDSKLKRFHTYEDVTEVRVDAKLASVTFDLTTNDGPLLQAGITGMYSNSACVNQCSWD